MNLNSKKATDIHKEIISTNKFLNRIYADFYKTMKSFNIPNGPVIEIGSGGGFIKEIIPKVITSDVLITKGIDTKLNIEAISYTDNSISAFYMLNVFHHIKNPTKALKEMSRTLKNGGKIIMIEPWPTLFSKFIYKNFHHEKFDINSDWRVQGKGRMSDANGALPWIVFKRDINQFKKLFPELKISLIKLHTPFKYLVSGGLTRKQFLPTYSYDFINSFEKKLGSLNKYLALFATIVITKANTRTKHG